VANSHRNPGRCAATMIALTVGVGVITVASVVTSTAHSYAFSQLEHHYPADYILTPLHSRNAEAQPTLPPRVAQQLRAQPQIAEAAEMRRGTASSNGVDLGVLGVDPSAYGVAWRPDLSAGSVDSLATGTGSIALLDKVASRVGVGVGSTLQVRMGHEDRQMRVAGIFATRFGGEEALVSWQDFNASFGAGGDDTVLLKVKPGTSIVDGQAAIDRATASDPLVAVQSLASYKTQITSSIDTILALFAGLLAVAIVIALFGIANTLSLSVIERTRESGLLRALGLTRSQLRGMLGAEALLLGLMGGLIGVVIGIGFGWAVAETFIRGSGGSGIGSVSYPVTEIVAYVMLAAVAGLVAGVLPARKAAKASVIDAIAET
jgi:putative ABC transport system permease protein